GRGVEQFPGQEGARRIRVLVLTAAGRTFCAGFNLGELAPERYDESAPGFDRLVDQLEALRVPTIAAVGGSLYGGGTDLALACDFRIGVPGIELMMPASRIGVQYYPGGVGPPRAPAPPRAPHHPVFPPPTNTAP